MSKKFWIAFIVFGIFFIGLAITAMISLGQISGLSSSRGKLRVGVPKVAMIYLEGIIVGDSKGGADFFSGNLVSSVEAVRLLEDARQDSSVKAVLLRVNSPGGSAAASQEIYNAIKKLKEEKPVVVSMGDLAASGGYYISSAANYIFANPATLTGSIGVLFDTIEFSELMKNVGISSQTLKAGEFKDIASPWRKMTEKERELLQEMLDQVHHQFIKAVAEGRKIDESKVKAVATGVIMTGEQAVKVGLADAVGGLEDAKVKARELGKLPKDAEVVEYKKKPSLFELFEMFGSETRLSALLKLKSGTQFENGLESLARRLFLSDIGFSLR